MSIKISQYNTVPSLAFDEIHINEIRILLPEEQVAKAQVSVTYKLLGRDAQGVKHFAPAQFTFVIEDAYADAAEKSSKGMVAMGKALTAIEEAIAEELKDQGIHGNTSTVL